MVRTRDTASVKVAGAKAPRKAAFTPVASSSDDSSGKNKYSGGNSYCPRETPAWQKNITSFFNATSSSSSNCPESEGSSKTSSNGSSTKTTTETTQSNETCSATFANEDSSNKENVAESSS